MKKKAELPPRTSFPNYAGRRDVDPELIAELTHAGIPHQKLPESMREHQGEVKTIVIGELHGWAFQRFWHYWVAKGPGLPLDAATRLHMTHGKDCRVDGHAGALSPLERFEGLGTGAYHVDTAEGLRALAETISSVVERATTVLKLSFEGDAKLRYPYRASVLRVSKDADGEPIPGTEVWWPVSNDLGNEMVIGDQIPGDEATARLCARCCNIAYQQAIVDVRDRLRSVGLDPTMLGSLLEAR